MDPFESKIALITGGASGIGRAVGVELAARGAVVRLADRNAELVTQAAEQIRQTGGNADSHVVDVTDRQAVADWVDQQTRANGRLDYLFNNAGIAIQGEAREHTNDHWDQTLDVNLRGVVYGVQAAYPIMCEQGFGHIVNTASVAGLSPAPSLSAYATAKHAVVGLSTTLRTEAAGLGVRCTVVCPGVIETPLMQTMTILDEAWLPGGRDELFRRLPFRPYTPRRCAQVILRGVERNKAIIVVTPHAKVMWTIYRLFPSLAIRISTMVATRARREIGRHATTGTPRG